VREEGKASTANQADRRCRVNIHENAALWRAAAEELRQRPPGGPNDPGQYALLGIGRLLDALANAADRGDDLRFDLVTAADELAGHIHRYVPRDDPGSDSDSSTG
jgi:hypothetical protein